MGPLLGSISALAATSVATAAVNSGQFVGFDGAPAGAGDDIFGVAKSDATIGMAFAVDVIGIIDLIAGAAIPAFSAVQSDANGAPVVLAGGTRVGTALTAAANPGDVVKVLIK